MTLPKTNSNPTFPQTCMEASPPKYFILLSAKEVQEHHEMYKGHPHHPAPHELATYASLKEQQATENATKSRRGKAQEKAARLEQLGKSL